MAAADKQEREKAWRILVINPGSTSTKIAVFDDEEQVFEEVLRHSAEELDAYGDIAAQKEFRGRLVTDALSEHGVSLEELDAISCRGGLMAPIPSGTYRVNETMLRDCASGEFGEHASNLGALIGNEIGVSCGAPVFVVDPPSVDELCSQARYSGHPIIRRTSLFHALNQKAVAREYASRIGKKYEDLNLVVCHMGGGVSVGAHRKGQVMDTENAVGGEGPFTPQRAGSMPVDEIVKLCFSGDYSQDEIMEMMVGEGGMYAYAGTTSVRDLVDRAGSGEEEVRGLLDAFCYQIAKEIGAMSAAMRGQVDQIILTGGIAYSDALMQVLKKRIEWIAPVTVIPGEEEMLSLAQGALRVLRGEEEAREYDR